MRLVDVARMADVSISTASRVMRNQSVVREEVAKRVWAAANELGYVPNGVAGGLKSQQSKIIAIVFPTVRHSVFTDALEAAKSVTDPTDYLLIYGESSYDLDQEEQVIRKLGRWRPDGIILVGTNHTPATRQMLKNLSVPVVEIWDKTETPIHASVGFSNFDAARDLAVELVSKEYTRFGLITGPLSPGNRANKRVDGFSAGLSASGLKPNWQIELGYDIVLSDLSRAAEVLAEHMARLEDVDCIFCTNELSGLSAIRSLKDRGLRVPEDIAVCGFGDVDAATLVQPSLTSVSLNGAQMGRRAVELILHEIETGHSVYGNHEDVGYRISWRKSTR